MTRKDYHLILRVVSSIDVPGETKEQILRGFAVAFSAEYANFDKGKFLAAAAKTGMGSGLWL